jgi:glycosyltransferase involved in cell wall biosynthesis
MNFDHLIILSFFTEPIEKSGGVSVLAKDVLDESPRFTALSLHKSAVSRVASLQSKMTHNPASNIFVRLFFWFYISLKLIRYTIKNATKFETITSCNIIVSVVLSLIEPKKLVIWENIDYLKQRKRLNLLRLAFALRRGSRLIVTTQYEYDKLTERFSKFAANIVYASNWTPDLSLPKLENRISCVGFLEKRKGFDLLIANMPKDNSIPVHIFGNGPEKSDLERQIRQVNTNVSLRGFTSSGYVEIEKSRGFILPSRYEGSPLVLLHAIKAGIPVAVSSEVSDCDLFQTKMGEYFHKLTISDNNKLKLELADFFRFVEDEPKRLKNQWGSKTECIETFLNFYS